VYFFVKEGTEYFSSPGAARSHVTALNNAEGTFKFNGVLFSAMYLSNSPQAV
jgi:hypothetical protein